MRCTHAWWLVTLLWIGLRPSPTLQATEEYESKAIQGSSTTDAADASEKYIVLYCNLSKRNPAIRAIASKLYTYTWVVRADEDIQGVLTFVLDYLFSKHKNLFGIDLIARQGDGDFQSIFSGGSLPQGNVSTPILDQERLVGRLKSAINFEGSFKQYAQWKRFGNAFLLSTEDMTQYLATGLSYLTQADMLKDVDQRLVSAAVWDLLIDNLQGKSTIYAGSNGRLQLGSLQNIDVQAPQMEVAMQKITHNFISHDATTTQGFGDVPSGLTGLGVGAAVTYVTLKLAYPSPKKGIHQKNSNQ